MTRRILAIICLILPFVVLDAVHSQQRSHTVFFEKTDYELHVYKIYGKAQGKTILVIDGIKKDKPERDVCDDLYSDFFLEKGNLVFVPIAQFQSIILNQYNIDNDAIRKFAGNRYNRYENKIFEILRKLILESDYLLTLQNNPGFFSEKWEAENRNPRQYGQSIIIDCHECTDPETGKKFFLDAAAIFISKQINKKIKNSKNHFHFNNFSTNKTSFPPKKLSKSAIYYALNTCGIPAFEVVMSEELPLDMGFYIHKLVIDSFMERFDIIPEKRGIKICQPELHYLLVYVNDLSPKVIKNTDTLYINQDDTIMISHIEANYQRGLSVDIAGYGTTNDIRKKIRITEPSRITVRKDYQSCGYIYIAFSKNGKKISKNGLQSKDNNKAFPPFLFFIVKINGKKHIFNKYERVALTKGDTVEIVDVITNHVHSSDLALNFRGFASNPLNNTGEDRNVVINTGKDLFEQFSLDKNGKTYEIVVSYNENHVGKLFVELTDPVLKYVVVQSGEDNKQCIINGDMAFIKPGKSLKLIDIKTNVKKNLDVKIIITGSRSFRRTININESVILPVPKNYSADKPFYCYTIDFERDSMALGSIFIDFE